MGNLTSRDGKGSARKRGRGGAPSRELAKEKERSDPPEKRGASRGETSGWRREDAGADTIQDCRPAAAKGEAGDAIESGDATANKKNSRKRRTRVRRSPKEGRKIKVLF